MMVVIDVALVQVLDVSTIFAWRAMTSSCS